MVFKSPSLNQLIRDFFLKNASSICLKNTVFDAGLALLERVPEMDFATPESAHY